MEYCSEGCFDCKKCLVIKEERLNFVLSRFRVDGDVAGHGHWVVVVAVGDGGDVPVVAVVAVVVAVVGQMVEAPW